MDFQRNFQSTRLHEPTPSPKAKSGKPWRTMFLGLFLVGTIFLAGITFFSWSNLQPVSLQSESQNFDIKPNDSWQTIANNLEKQSLIRSSLLFSVLVKISNANFVKAGVYSLTPAMSSQQILAKLRSGETDEGWIRLPEGWRIDQFKESLVNKGYFSEEDLDQALAPSQYNLPFLEGQALGSLEGFLFPDTYKVPKKYTAKQFIQLTLDTFAKKITPLKSDLTSQSLSLYQVVTLASIIEKEASNTNDRRMIAGVFLNRLNQGISLGSCPTILYALGDWNAPLTTKNLAIDSPYNTRLYKGLPPGPISSPSLSSIEAVLRPEKSDYLFFLAKDGVTYYSKTNEEHEALREKYGVY